MRQTMPADSTVQLLQRLIQAMLAVSQAARNADAMIRQNLRPVLATIPHQFDFKHLFSALHMRFDLASKLKMSMARTFQEMDRYEDALRVYDQMESNEHVLMSKARCFEEMKRFDDAYNLLIFVRPVDRQPGRLREKQLKLLLSIGRCLQGMGQHERAIREIYEPNCKVFPEMRMTLGRCWQEMGGYDNAKEIFALMDQRDPEVMLAIGICMIEGADYGEALVKFEEARLMMRAQGVDVFNVLLAQARCYYHIEHLNLADLKLNELVRMRPDDISVQLLQGRCLQKAGNHKRALKIYREIQNPTLDVKLTIAGCYIEMEQYDHALAVYCDLNSTNEKVQEGIRICREGIQRREASLMERSFTPAFFGAAAAVVATSEAPRESVAYGPVQYFDSPFELPSLCN